jgi:hypothetical protein
MAFTLSPNMNLPVPTVGSEPGPDYALDVNAALSIIDTHNHSAGSGVPVTPDGLSISSDLTFLDNNAIALRSARFQAQPAVLALADDLQCVYVTGVDLYYNDGNGNQVRITQSGGVAGSPGSISNLTSPASASYVSGSETFVWQSNTNKPANLDGGFIKLRNNSTNSKALTLSPPAAMGSDFALTLPSLPVTTNIVTLDASGNFGAALNVDNSSLQWSSNTLAVKAKGVTQNMLANRATGTTVAAGGVAVSTQQDNFVGSNTTWEAAAALTCTITTTGRPVRVFLIPGIGPASPGDPAGVVGGAVPGGTPSDLWVSFGIFNGATQISHQDIYFDFPSGITATYYYIPCGSIEVLDFPAAGTYTYTVQAQSNNANSEYWIMAAKLIAYEI